MMDDTKPLTLDIDKFKRKPASKVKTLFQKIFMPWEVDKPYALPWGGWDTFNEEQKEKYPIRWFLFDTVTSEISYKMHYVSRKIWELKHRYIPKYQYHIIRTTLDPKEYHDPDHQILYATMDIVKEFVEQTSNTIDWTSEEGGHADVWKELQIVYNWWVNVFPNREELLPKHPDVDFKKIIGDENGVYENDPDVVEWRRVSDIHNATEIQWKLDEEEMLVRVMKVRGYLWYP